MKKRKTTPTPLSTPTTTATATGISSSGGSRHSNNNTTVNAASKSSIVSSFAVTNHEAKKRQERVERFAVNPSSAIYAPPTTTLGDTTMDDADAAENITSSPYYDILGRNMEIEKSYLRLTTYPKCELVRPLPVLIKALEHVKRKYQQNDDFDWCHDQLKSIRQDITVQKSHISANHTLRLDVYQTHARILLEHGQLSEFNQCLSNVLQIYDAFPPTDNIEHSSNAKCAIRKSQGEFRAYSILYSLVQSKTTFLDLNMALRRRLEQIVSMLPPQEEKRPKTQSTKFNHKKGKKRHRSTSTVTATTTSNNVSGNENTNHHHHHHSLGLLYRLSVEEQHAWAVVQTMYDGPYTKFFNLYDAAPCMSPYLMDFLLHRVRVEAYALIMTAHRPSVSLRYLRETLHFDTAEELHRFLQQRNTVFLPLSDDGNKETMHSNDSSSATAIEHLLIDCRQSHLILMQSRNP